MTVTGKLYVKHPNIGLVHTIKTVPEASIEVLSNAGTDPENDTYFFVIDTEHRDQLEAALDKDPTVADASRQSSYGSSHIYQIRYSTDAILLSPKATEVGGIMHNVRTHDEGWMIEFQFPNRKALYRLWEFAQQEDILLELIELHQKNVSVTNSSHLTEAQHEALITAYTQGYFREPRESSLEEIADSLGISPSAAGGRLRRGTNALIKSELVDDDAVSEQD